VHCCFAPLYISFLLFQGSWPVRFAEDSAYSGRSVFQKMFSGPKLLGKMLGIYPEECLLLTVNFLYFDASKLAFQ